MREIKKNGFTLIELLAVIVILGIIMVIAVPAVTKYIDKSKKDSFVSTAKMYIDAAQKAVSAGDYLPPTTSTDQPLKILVSDLKIQKGGQTSPYGNKYKIGSYIIVTSDSEGNLTYKITLIDEKNNAIAEKTLKQLNDQGAKSVKVVKNIALPREYNVGDKVTLKDGGGSYTVIEYASINALTLKLLSDNVVKADLSGYDTSCIGENMYCSSVKFVDPPYGNNTIDLNSIDANNIGYYITNFQTQLRTKYDDDSITVDLPTVDEILTLAGINKTLSQLYTQKYGTNIYKDDGITPLIVADGINLGDLNAKNLDIINKNQTYWLKDAYSWTENGSTNNWRIYLRTSYGIVINAYWSNKDNGPGFRPVVTIPVSEVE